MDVSQNKMEVCANLFKIELTSKRIYQHVVTIYLFGGNLKTEMLLSTLHVKNRGDRLTKIGDNYLLVEHAVKSIDDSVFAYDGAGLFYSTRPIDKTMTIDIDLAKEIQLSEHLIDTVKFFEASIKVCIASEMEFDQNDQTLWISQEFQTYLNILTSQDVIKNKTYVAMEKGIYLPVQEEQDERLEKFARPVWGFHKSCRAIGQKDVHMVVELDPCETRVLPQKNVAEVLQKAFPTHFKQNGDYNNNGMNQRALDILVKGQNVYPWYDDIGVGTNSFVIYNLTTQKTPEYKQQFPNLRFPNYPAAVTTKGRQFPLERLRIKRFQILSTKILDAFHMIPRAREPKFRYQKMCQQFEELNLKNSKILAAFGVQVVQSPQTMAIFEGERVAEPQVRGNAGNLNLHADKRSWMLNNKFAKPAAPSTIIAAIWQPNRRYASGDVDMCKKVVDSLRDVASKKGLNLSVIGKIPSDDSSLDMFMTEVFGSARTERNSIVLFFSEVEDYIHNNLKILEQEYDVPSQHLILNTAREMFSQINKGRNCAALQNLVLKLNVKLGGENVTAEVPRNMWCDQSTFVVGIDVAHPTQEDAQCGQPSTVGLSCNAGYSHFSFVGDFFFTEPKQEMVEPKILELFVTNQLKAFMKKGRNPKRVLIYRDGVSFGQEEDAIREVDIIARTVEMVTKTKPLVMAVVVTKRHHTRIYNSQFENLKAETAVYKDISDSNRRQLMIQSYTAIKGTAKIPIFWVIRDDGKVDNETLSKIVVASCSQHQLVNSPTSLPTAVFVAHEMAKRGTNIFRTHQ